jgi:hypothetical protein
MRTEPSTASEDSRFSGGNSMTIIRGTACSKSSERVLPVGVTDPAGSRTYTAPGGVRYLHVALAIAVFASLACVPTGEDRKCTDLISPAEAVASAERFAVAQGYTDAPPEEEGFARQSMEDGTREEVLAMRSRLLRPGAVGYLLRYERWHILFTFETPRNESNRETGRAVSMDRCGGDIRMEHQGAFLDTAEVVLGEDPMRGQSRLH